MQIFELVILGIIQGLTEFLPVSSSGHLAILQDIFDISSPSLFFEIFLHVTTLLAVIIFFWKDLLSLTARQAGYILFGSLPIVLAGGLLIDRVQFLAGSTAFVAVMLIITGMINLFTDNFLERQNNAKFKSEQLTERKAFIVGIVQMLAVLPGISRSGSTVLGGISQKVDREEAFRFSFLLSIPAILGAVVLLLTRQDLSEVNRIGILPLLLAGSAAFVTGLMSLKLLHYMMKTAKFQWFAYYCFLVGVGILILEYRGGF